MHIDNDRQAARAGARYMMGLRREGGWPLALAIAAPLVSGGLLIVQALLIARVLHRAVTGGEPVAALWPLLAWMGAIFAVRAALAFLAERAGIAAAERIKQNLRDRLFARMLGHRPHWTAERPSGALAATVIDGVEALDGFFARFLPAMVQAAVLPVAIAVVIMPVDWVVGLLFLLTAPLIPLFMALVGWGAEAATRAQASAFARLSGYFADRLRGLMTLKLFGRDEIEAEAMRGATDELRRRTLGVLAIAFLSSAVLEFFAALGVAGVALYVGLTYLGFIDLRAVPLTLEAGLFCLLLAPEVYQPLRLLAAHYHDRAAAKAAVAEIAEHFGELPEAAYAPAGEAAHDHMIKSHVPLPPAAVPAGMGGWSVFADDFTLATPDGRPVLEDARFMLAPGSRTALTGETGSGKSTLLETLAGLRHVPPQLRIGQLALAAFPPVELRAGIAMLGQRPRIFHGTIADNIRFGRPDATTSEILAAAERAQVLAFAAHMPGGLDAMVGEGGLGLSGGEAHRVALARIYLRDPALILLDEPTAHLDTETEGRVLDGLIAFARGRTLLLATHSAAAAARMDRVLHIAGGRLITPAAQSRECAA